MNKQTARKPCRGNGGTLLPGPGPGRPKGKPNKLSRTTKENIEAVYEKLGGVDEEVKFLNSHPAVKAQFYVRVHPLLLPQDINLGGTGKDGAPLRIEVVHTKGADTDGGNGNGNGDGKGGAK